MAKQQHNADGTEERPEASLKEQQGGQGERVELRGDDRRGGQGATGTSPCRDFVKDLGFHCEWGGGF